MHEILNKGSLLEICICTYIGMYVHGGHDYRFVNLRSCSGMSICAYGQECQFVLMLRNQASPKHALHEDIDGVNMELTSAAFYLSSRQSFAVSVNHKQASTLNEAGLPLTLLRRLTRRLKMQ